MLKTKYLYSQEPPVQNCIKNNIFFPPLLIESIEFLNFVLCHLSYEVLHKPNSSFLLVVLTQYVRKVINIEDKKTCCKPHPNFVYTNEIEKTLSLYIILSSVIILNHENSIVVYVIMSVPKPWSIISYSIRSMIFLYVTIFLYDITFKIYKKSTDKTFSLKSKLTKLASNPCRNMQKRAKMLKTCKIQTTSLAHTAPSPLKV